MNRQVVFFLPLQVGLYFPKFQAQQIEIPRETIVPACMCPSQQVPASSKDPHLFPIDWWCECLPHSEDPTPTPRCKSWSLGSRESNSVIDQAWVSCSYLQHSKESAFLELWPRVRMDGLPRKIKMLFWKISQRMYE